MRIRVILSIVLMLSFCVSPVFAQEDQRDERIVVNRSDIPPTLLAEIEGRQKVQQYSEYAGLGREVVEALNGGLEAVTEQTNNFAQTPIGKLTAIVIVWKVIGTDFVQLIIGLPLLVIWVAMSVWSYRRNCIPYAMLAKVSADGEKTYRTANEGYSKDGEKFTHAIAFFFGIAIICLITFAG